jgi:transcriptional regulator GlxA family with amidase domain
MRVLLDLRESRLPTRDQIAQHVGMQMLYQCIGEASLLGKTRIDSVERAQAWIDQRLHVSIDLDAIAAGAAMSKSHLISMFKQRIGVTPISYLWTRRTELGIELLESTELSIRDIAERCGFRTAHHFSSRIKDVTGLRPTELRDRAWAPRSAALKPSMGAGSV